MREVGDNNEGYKAESHAPTMIL